MTASHLLISSVAQRFCRIGWLLGRLWLQSFICMLVIGVAMPARGQPQTIMQGSSQPSPPADGARAQAGAGFDRADATKKLMQARAELESLSSSSASVSIPAGLDQSEVLERRAMLERLIAVYAGQVQNADKLAVAEQRREEFEKQAREWLGFSEPPPYSVFLVDRLRSSLQRTMLQIESSQARLSIITGQMEAARHDLESAEESLRQIQERLEQPAGAHGEDIVRWSRDMAQLRRRLAAAHITAADADTKVASAEIAGYRFHGELLRKQLTIASSNMRFTQADVDKVVADLKKQQIGYEQELKQAQAQSEEAHRALEDAKTMLARIPVAPNRDAARLADLVELRQTQARNSELSVDVARLKVEASIQERNAWQHRMLLATSKDPGKLREAAAGVGEAVQRLGAWARYIDGEIALTTVQIDEQDRRIRAAASTGEIARLDAIQKAFEERSALYHDAKEFLAILINTLSLWRQQYAEERAARTFWPTMRAAWDRVRDAAHVIWNFELFNADDTVEVDGKKITAKRSVTVGKSIGAVLVLLFGYVLTAWLMRRAERELVQRFHVEPNVGEILRRWGQFLMLAVLFVFALNLVKIPLTLFAFLGGALAIGVGFGAQNLLKNLMSGIILLIERPLRVGDVVEMGGALGAVTDISIRASTVRSGNGVERLIPNSNFLENVVTNWTYSDRRVRRDITVSVPRTASTRQVSELLLATAQRHGQLLKDPPPRILLQDLGLDTLTFSVQYWMELRSGVDAEVVASDLRFMIETALKDAGLSKSAPEAGAPEPVPENIA